VDTKLRSDHREDKAVSHGGMPVQKFIEEAMQAVGNAKYSNEKRRLYLK